LTVSILGELLPDASIPLVRSCTFLSGSASLFSAIDRILDLSFSSVLDDTLACILPYMWTRKSGFFTSAFFFFFWLDMYSPFGFGFWSHSDEQVPLFLPPQLDSLGDFKNDLLSSLLLLSCHKAHNLQSICATSRADCAVYPPGTPGRYIDNRPRSNFVSPPPCFPLPAVRPTLALELLNEPGDQDSGGVGSFSPDPSGFSRSH